MINLIRRLQNTSLPLLIFGWFLAIYGVGSFVANEIARIKFGFPFDFGIILGNGAIALTGLVAISAASRLRKLEDRMDRLEKGQR